MQRKQWLAGIGVSLAFALMHCAMASAATITLQDGLSGYTGTEDTQLEKNQSVTAAGEDDFNYGATTTLEVFNRSVRESFPVVRFDLSPLANALSINSASLILTTNTVSGSGVLELFRIANADRAWVEGTGTGTTVVGASTYNNRLHSGTSWSVVTENSKTGFLGNNGLLDTNATIASAGSPNQFDFAGDLSFLIDWANNPGNNAGFLVVSQNGDNYLPGNGFHSSESLTAAFRPQLVIDFEVPVPIPEPSSFLLLSLGAISLLKRKRVCATSACQTHA